MSISFERLEDHIPPYLTKQAKEGLAKALADFPRAIGYYLNRYWDELLQGDGWAGLDVVNLESGDRKKVKGIVLSNSCDIDVGNDRAIPPRLVFAPLVSLDRYVESLRGAGIEAGSIENKLQAIREQSVTSIFYLPKGSALTEECIALLDNLHTVPLDRFTSDKDRKKLFTLDTVGFYLFLFKLSVHFCRFHENVAREEEPQRG
ncbi:hypothetical protein FAZ69_23365 [Trinickia terrae]|uniref:Uncharacterized protein n=1 Tax=Trinickia terrae TaxID=2571161 RepID=A0A4U1HUQ1_9BURK|nr:hypothetical protein [Trinickia terrae]TKC83434.1 hypothetical protein FAZ69_23365 [Trinickia terrae]